MNLQKYQEISSIFQNTFNVIEIDVSPFADSDEGCYIRFYVKEMPKIEIAFSMDGPSEFSVSSVWHGLGAGKSRFGTPPVIHSINRVISKIHEMIQEYLDCSDRIVATRSIRYYESLFNIDCTI